MATGSATATANFRSPQMPTQLFVAPAQPLGFNKFYSHTHVWIWNLESEIWNLGSRVGYTTFVESIDCGLRVDIPPYIKVLFITNWIWLPPLAFLASQLWDFQFIRSIQ